MAPNKKQRWNGIMNGAQWPTLFLLVCLWRSPDPCETFQFDQRGKARRPSRGTPSPSLPPSPIVQCALSSWLGDRWFEFTGKTQGTTAMGDQPMSLPRPPKSSTGSRNSTGTVIRLAARSYNATSSKPSSPFYTTRKDSLQTLTITKSGASRDYNHYRTIALNSTYDRAISILSVDVMEFLRNTTEYSSCQDGDLGENILVEGLPFDSFQVGQRYRFHENGDGKDEPVPSSAVLLEITEPIIPCANLCKLSFINDELKTPQDRIQTCQHFLEALGQDQGLRGWYAKVLQEGEIRVGDTMQINKNSQR